MIAGSFRCGLGLVRPGGRASGTGLMVEVDWSVQADRQRDQVVG